MASPHQKILDALGKFRVTWPRHGWSWDNRFQCVASTFDADFSPQARALIGVVLPYAFTDRTLSTAGPLVSAIATRCGGLRAAQLIFSADRIGYVTPYGLWWPWEEGRTISLRIGLEGMTPNDSVDLAATFGAEV